MTTPSTSYPVVALVGSVNVGKSTLFNRLAGRMVAIVHDRAGVTRDIRKQIVESPYGDFTLWDTPGIISEKQPSLHTKVTQHTIDSFSSCNLFLFVFDGKVGPSASDFSCAKVLQKENKTVILIANKTEGSIDLNIVYESKKFGFGDPVLCSAEHGLGIDDILIAIQKNLTEKAQTPENQTEKQKQSENPIKLAIIGRPNVGKSSLTNRLLQEYRMITGPEAGITRDSITSPWIWNHHMFHLVDTAGIRKRAKTTDSLEKLAVSDSLASLRTASIVALLFEPDGVLEKQDLLLASKAFEYGVPIILIINKWDTVNRKDSNAILATLKTRIKNATPILGEAPFITMSAATGFNINNLPKTALELHRMTSTQFSTPNLNKWLQLAVKKYPPPLTNQNKPVKLRYIVQKQIQPISCVIFGHRTNDLTPSYTRYLSNSFRKHFKLSGVPLRFFFRQQSREKN